MFSKAWRLCYKTSKSAHNWFEYGGKSFLNVQTGIVNINGKIKLNYFNEFICINLN